MTKTDTQTKPNRQERRKAAREAEKAVKKAKKENDDNPSSIRKAFIRVSAVNHIKKDNEELGLKAGDVLEYTKEDIKEILDKWCETKEFSYFFIQHDDAEDEVYQDDRMINTDESEEIGNRHFHIVLDLPSPTEFYQIKAQFPYGHIESCGKGKNRKKNKEQEGFTACIQYLVHLNSPDKKLYPWTDVISNDYPQLELNKQPVKNAEEKLLKQILYSIKRGEIKEYEIEKKVELMFHINHMTKIERAVKIFYKELFKDKDFRRNHPVKIVVLQGKTRAGKTTFAEEQLIKKELEYCISSSTNDMFQDYMGEPGFILDDVSHKEIDIKDLVKFLDPHKKSSTKSRYRNKLFVGNYVFICTNVPITEWYEEADEDDRDSLFSRIDFVYDFDETANHNDGNSYFSINRIVYDTEEGYDVTLDSNGLVEKSRKKRVLLE